MICPYYVLSGEATTRRVSLVEQILLIPSRGTWIHTLFYWGSCYSIFSFMCMFCRSLFVLLSFFLFAIVLSILLRFTDSYYPFGILKFSLRLHSLVESNGHRFHVRPNSKPARWLLYHWWVIGYNWIHWQLIMLVITWCTLEVRAKLPLLDMTFHKPLKWLDNRKGHDLIDWLIGA
jgi:hypothetical protein